MLRAVTLPSPPAVPSALRRPNKGRMEVRCLSTCHAPPMAEIASPSLASPSYGTVGYQRRPPASLYEVLRVKRTATPTEIKTAYRALAKMYHPDTASRQDGGDGGREFMEIHNAYETLSDPAARAMYDLKLGNQQRRATVGFSPTRRWETDQCW